jgi:aspartyl-tRNA(Asn)/glutamyl-tRNA(Gln) amidotransferase subunit A
VEDAALALDVISTPDERDSTCGRAPRENHLAACGRGVKGLKIGIPKEYFTSALDPEVESLVRAGIKTLESLGAEIREISLPHTEHAVAAYYVVAEAEASSNLARYDGVQYGLRVAAEDMISTFRKTRSAGFGPEVTRRILLGTFVLSSGFYDAYYAKAKKVQTLIRRDFEAAFREVGAIACPVAPTAAFKIGEKISNPLEMYLSDILTVALNLAGLPGIAIPCGFTKSKLPAGLQIIAPPGKDALMLQTAAAYERATEWHKQIPPLAKGE